jgi:hypothetical protein
MSDRERGKPLRRESVTHVSGIIRYPCVRNGPLEFGAPGEIRTPDPLVRRETLERAQVSEAPEEHHPESAEYFPLAGVVKLLVCQEAAAGYSAPFGCR